MLAVLSAATMSTVLMAGAASATTGSPILARTITIKTGIAPITYTVLDSKGNPTAVTGTAVITTPWSDWLAASSVPALAGSSWISTDIKDGTITGRGLGATTRYRTTFALPAGYSAPSLTITLAADDGATVLLNGHRVAAQTLTHTADDDKYHRQPWAYSTADPTMFVAGTNTLDVQVEDYGPEAGIDYVANVTYTPGLVNVSGVTLTGPGSAGVGIGALPLDTLPVAGLLPQTAAQIPSASPASVSLARSTITSLPAARIPAARIPAARIPAARIPAARIPAARIPAARIPAARIGTSILARLLNAHLSDLPLVAPGGWPAFLAGTRDFTTSLPQTTTVADLATDYANSHDPGLAPLLDPTCGTTAGPAGCTPLTLDQFLVDGTPLAQIQALAVLLNGITWNDVAPPTSAGWCADFASLPVNCTTTTLDGANPDLAVTQSIFESSLSGLDLGATSLGLRSIGDLTTSPRRPLFLDLPVAPLNITGTFLGDVTTVQLAAAGKSVSQVVDCTKVVCPTDLRTASKAGAINAAATLGDLGSTINGALLADLVLAFADATSLPWEQMSLAGAHVERLFPGTAPAPLLGPGLAPEVAFIHQTLSFSLPCGEPAVATVTLAAGFGYRPGSSRLAVGAAAATGIADPAADATGAVLTWRVPAQPCAASTASTASPPDAIVLDFQSLPALTTGSAPASASVAVDLAGATAGTASAVTKVAPDPAGARDLGQNPNALIVGQISGPGDVDLFTVKVPAGKSLSVTLSQLKYDADLVLYAPPGTTPASLLHGTTPRQVPAATDPIADPGSGGATLPPPVLADIPLQPGADVAGISAFRGTDGESITTPTVGGTYTIQVSGYNGAGGPDPYTLVARLADPPQLPPCSATATIPGGPNAVDTAGVDALIPSPFGVGAAVDTLYLVDAPRLVRAFGATTAASIITDLRASTAVGGHTAALIPVNRLGGVSAAFDAWDASPCDVALSNAVVKAIDDGVDGLGQAPGSLAGVRNIVIVGDGTIIPHAALPDATTATNERDFVGETLQGGQSTLLTAAVGNGRFLSDAPFGSFQPLSVRGQIVYLPQVALGRLGGSGDAIDRSIQQYTALNGLAGDPSRSSAQRTAFESDYDFFADAGTQIRATLQAQLSSGNVTSLSGPAWDSTALANAFFPSGGRTPDVLVPNAHADPTRVLSANGSTTGSGDSYTAAQIGASPPGSMAARILFTIGCHFALDLPGGATTWESALQDRSTAVVVGNLGYGIGDSAALAFDERLLATYATELDGSRSAGAGLVDAQQTYFRSMLAWSPYDLKVLEQITLWGFPTYSLPTVNATAPTSPAATPLVTDPATGLKSTTIPVSIGTTLHRTVVTDPAGGPARVYYDNAGLTTSTSRYPIMPQVLADLPPGTGGEVAHGALPLTLTVHDIAISPTDADAPGGYAFAGARLAATSGGPAPTGSTVFPSAFANVGTSFAADGSARQQLTLTPAQFRSGSGDPAFGMLRTFTDTTWLVTYSKSTDFEGPRFGTLEVLDQGGHTALSAVVTDTNGVARVLAQVLRPGSPDSVYQRVELLRDGTSDRFSGVVNATDVTEVTFYATDRAGNTSVANNKGPGFPIGPGKNGNVGSGQITTTPTAPTLTGWFTSATTATAGNGFQLFVDGSATPAPAALGDGSHVLQSFAPGASPATGSPANALTVFVDRTGPTITGSATPAANAAGWNATPVSVSFACSDATSGVASGCDQTTVLSSDTAGQTVSATVLDNAGNSASATIGPIRIDQTAPDLSAVLQTATVPPLPAPAWSKDSVVVHWTASDALSGIATAPADVTLTDETPLAGTTVPGAATDNAGNSTTATSPPVKIDRHAPAVTAIVPSPNASGWYTTPVVDIGYSCADALSGVAYCPDDVILRGDGVYAGVTSGQTSGGQASDVAGNTAAPLTTDGPFRIDHTMPQTLISSSCSPICVTSGTVTLTASDSGPAGPGSGVAATYYAIDGGTPTLYTAPFPVFDSLLGRTITFWSTDNAGNVEGINTATFSLNNAGPGITHTISPAPVGEWNTSLPVTVQFTVTDGTPAAPVTVTGEGVTTVTAYASDSSGNTSSDTATVKVDVTPPTIVAAADRQPDAGGWYNHAVTVRFTCTDPAGSSGAAGSGIPAGGCPDPILVARSTLVQVLVMDTAGNRSAPTNLAIQYDDAAPALSIGGVADHAVYTLGAVPTPTCSASDGGSGASGQSCTVAVTGGTANRVGDFTATATAVDPAGNRATTSVRYHVNYRFGGFSAPTTTSGATAIVRAGVNVPVAFQLLQASGTGYTAVKLAAAPLWVAPAKAGTLSSAAVANSRGTTLAATTGTSYVWDTATSRYVRNWATSAAISGSYWRITVNLDDGQSYSTLVGVSRLRASDKDCPEDPKDPTHAAKG